MNSPYLFTPWEDIEALATGRPVSLFDGAYTKNHKNLEQQMTGTQVAVIGAAGSIGSEVVKKLACLPLKTLVLFDISENNLVEITRDLRSSNTTAKGLELISYPVGMGDPEFQGAFEKYEFQYVLNFSAMKHVRSEKNISCLQRMLRTNVFALDELMTWPGTQNTKIFSVSSDKAVRPANLMGASKCVMEQVLMAHGDQRSTSTARFANVAFSEGSLPSGFLKRLQKNQPLAGPSDIKRYFISHREAAELSILAAIFGTTGQAFFPDSKMPLPEVGFDEIAGRLLNLYGLEPHFCTSEDEAKQVMESVKSEKKWPCFFSKSNTTGEKILEEFVGPQEDKLNPAQFPEIGIATQTLGDEQRREYHRFIELYRSGQINKFKKSQVVDALRRIVPDLAHVEVDLFLDSKM